MNCIDDGMNYMHVLALVSMNSPQGDTCTLTGFWGYWGGTA